MLVYHPDSDIFRKCFKNWEGAPRPFYLGKIMLDGRTAKINYMINDNLFNDWQYGFRFFSIIDYRLYYIYEKKC
jgi:hypothetical protein